MGKVYRDSESGQYVDKEYADDNPKTTQGEENWPSRAVLTYEHARILQNSLHMAGITSSLYAPPGPEETVCFVSVPPEHEDDLTKHYAAIGPASTEKPQESAGGA